MRSAYSIIAQDITPTQFIRELVVNSIQAGATDIEIGPCSFNRNLLAVRDNGRGIANLKDKMALLNPTGTDNKGVGGKVASLRFSPYRVEFHTKTAQAVAQACALSYQDGLLTDPIKPRFSGSHGTEVVLYGEKEDDNTVSKPPFFTDERWLVLLSNRWIWNPPSGVKIRIWNNAESQKNYIRVQGAKHYCFMHAQDSGTVDLSNQYGVKVHWVLWPAGLNQKDKNKLALVNNFLGFGGGVSAVLYQNELYDIRVGRESWLSRFGVKNGKNRVGVFVEVPDTSRRYAPNIARTSLYPCDSFGRKLQEGFPADDMGTAFRDKMPKEITSMLQAMEKSSVQTSATRYFKRVLSFYTGYFEQRGGYSVVADQMESLVPGGLEGDPENMGDGRCKNPNVVDIVSRETILTAVVKKHRAATNNKKGIRARAVIPEINVTEIDGGIEGEFITCEAPTKGWDGTKIRINAQHPNLDLMQKNIKSGGVVMNKETLMEKMKTGLISTGLAAIQQAELAKDRRRFDELTSSAALEASVYGSIPFIARGVGVEYS